MVQRYATCSRGCREIDACDAHQARAAGRLWFRTLNPLWRPQRGGGAIPLPAVTCAKLHSSRATIAPAGGHAVSQGHARVNRQRLRLSVTLGATKAPRTISPASSRGRSAAALLGDGCGDAVFSRSCPPEWDDVATGQHGSCQRDGFMASSRSIWWPWRVSLSALP